MRLWPRSLRHRWEVIEERAYIAGPEHYRVVSRHWTHGGAEAAARLAADNWRNMAGEIKAGRAYWDGTWVTRENPAHWLVAPIAPGRLPSITYYPVPADADS